MFPAVILLQKWAVNDSPNLSRPLWVLSPFNNVILGNYKWRIVKYFLMFCPNMSKKYKYVCIYMYIISGAIFTHIFPNTLSISIHTHTYIYERDREKERKWQIHKHKYIDYEYNATEGAQRQGGRTGKKGKIIEFSKLIFLVPSRMRFVTFGTS